MHTRGYSSIVVTNNNSIQPIIRFDDINIACSGVTDQQINKLTGVFIALPYCGKTRGKPSENRNLQGEIKWKGNCRKCL